MSQFFNFSLGAVLNEMTRVGVDIGSKSLKSKMREFTFPLIVTLLLFP